MTAKIVLIVLLVGIGVGLLVYIVALSKQIDQLTKNRRGMVGHFQLREIRRRIRIALRIIVALIILSGLLVIIINIARYLSTIIE